jgi:hypothetical protein
MPVRAHGLGVIPMRHHVQPRLVLTTSRPRTIAGSHAVSAEHRSGAQRQKESHVQIIGDRHYAAAPGEIIAFTLGSASQVGSVAVSIDSQPAVPLPVSVMGGTHHAVTIAIGFTLDDEGGATINISGSDGGTDTSRIRQITGLPFRTVLFVVD